MQGEAVSSWGGGGSVRVCVRGGGVVKQATGNGVKTWAQSVSAADRWQTRDKAVTKRACSGGGGLGLPWLPALRATAQQTANAVTQNMLSYLQGGLKCQT